MLSDTPYDVLIIGAGPAGATAALYTARARLRTLLLDKAVLGGALAITHKIANYPGLGFEHELTGADLLRQMHRHARHFGAEFVQAHLYSLDLAANPKRALALEGAYAARAVIIATGAGSRARRLPGEDELLGRGVSYCAICDAAFFRDQEVAVVGNSDEAVEEAAVLAQHARTVHLLSPTARLIAEPEQIAALTARANVVVHLHRQVRAIVGSEAVEGVMLAGPEGQREQLPVAGVFIYLPGNQPATAFLDGQVQLDERGHVVTDADTRTSLPGVFAAGDVRGHAIQQVTLATADGTIAAIMAGRYVRAQLGATSPHPPLPPSPLRGRVGEGKGVGG